MQSAVLCVTCPHHLGICGALLQDPSSELQLSPRAACRRFRTAPADELVVAQNTTSEDVFVLCSGWAFRFFQLPDGRRQILSFLLPGDLFSLANVFSERFHYSVKALTEIQFRAFRREELNFQCGDGASMTTTLAKACVAASERADEMLAVLGQRSAEQRIAYLFLSLMRRISDQGVVKDHRYRFPLRHRHIGEAVGLTSVHVSRVLSHLRSRNIAELSDGILQVFDLQELQRIGSLS